ncbi:MAG: class I SAM-dependent methyltransferase family protein [Candidatus Micrarchaeota archaeon]|nr:class I SAM-dependent methyltransferase family protein [Candidatus Micrarchaeota archaeon]
MVLAVAVSKKDAEKARKFLISRGIINFSYNPASSRDKIFFPLAESEIAEEALKDLKVKHAVVRKRLKKKESKKVELPPFDMIGEIAIFELPKEFRDKPETEREKAAKKIARDIMANQKNIKTVAVKTGGIKGPFRIRSFKVVAGNRSTITIHKEHGCRFKLDVSKAYYSPRLSFERKRISSLIKEKETVFVPFAGVGPFAIIIAKNHPSASVYANELNPDAYRYLVENIKLNKVSNVIPIPGDARDLKTKEYWRIADRVVMPLPMSADQFLDVAFHLAKKGGTVHFYYFTDSIESAERVVMEAAEREGRKIKIIESRVVRDYSPDIIEVVVDFQIL